MSTARVVLGQFNPRSDPHIPRAPIKYKELKGLLDNLEITGPGTTPDAGMDFSAAANSQYLVLLEDI
jgi:hypothetical protein